MIEVMPLWIVTLQAWGTLLVRAGSEAAARALAVAWLEPHRQRTGAGWPTADAMIARIRPAPDEWTLCVISHYPDEVQDIAFE